MKRFLTFLCVLTLLVSCFAVGTAAETVKQPTIQSEAAIVMDADTGVTLYQRNETKQLPPADSAQIMTALLALESGKINETVNAFDPNGTNLSLSVGDSLTMRDLVYAMMLGSYSNAAKAIAITVSGTEKAFTEKMTARIQQITGTKNSGFANADGEPADGNRTTAKDLALLLQEALRNPEFRKIFGTAAYTVPAPNKNASSNPITTLCLLMRDTGTNVKYEGTIGGKSGWNKDAKYTLVSAAQRDGRTLVCVVLGSSDKNQRYSETIALFDYAFKVFRNVTVPSSLLAPTEVNVTDESGQQVLRTVVVSIPEGTKLTTNTEFQDGTMTISSSIPTKIKEGEIITLTISAKDKNGITVVLGSVTLDVAPRAEDNPSDTMTSEDQSANNGNLGGQTEKKKTVLQRIGGFFLGLLKFLLYVLLAIVILAIALFVMSYIQRKQRLARRKRRKEEQEETEHAGTRHASSNTGRRHRGSGNAEKPEDEVNGSEEQDDDEDEF